MSNARMWLREALGWSGVMLAVAMSIPLLGLATLLLRTVLVPMVAAALVGGFVVYCANGRFRCWACRLFRGDEARRHPAT